MEWISVKDALPDEDRPVLLTVRYKDWGKQTASRSVVFNGACRFTTENRWEYYDGFKYKKFKDWNGVLCNFSLLITHWMYWPEPAPETDDGVRPFWRK